MEYEIECQDDISNITYKKDTKLNINQDNINLKLENINTESTLRINFNSKNSILKIENSNLKGLYVESNNSNYIIVNNSKIKSSGKFYNRFCNTRKTIIKNSEIEFAQYHTSEEVKIKNSKICCKEPEIARLIFRNINNLFLKDLKINNELVFGGIKKARIKNINITQLGKGLSFRDVKNCYLKNIIIDDKETKMFHNLKDISIKLKNIEYNVDSIIYEQMKERYYNYNLNPVDKKLKTDLTAELITKKETKTHF